MAFDVAVLGKLFFNLGEITFTAGNVKGIGDGLQMLDLAFRICNLCGQRLLSTLQLRVPVKIFF